jgi:polygalacturonase
MRILEKFNFEWQIFSRNCCCHQQQRHSYTHTHNTHCVAAPHCMTTRARTRIRGKMSRTTSTLLLLLFASPSSSSSSHSSGGTFNVLDYGAKGDGKTLDTLAIRAALAAAGAAGGGTVLFPSSYTFLTGGSLNISANTVVQVEGRVQGVLDSTDYILGTYLPWMGPDAQVASQQDQREWQPFLTSWMQDNITIRGSGVIDMGGTADGWWGCASDVTKPPCNGHPRPHGVRLVGGTGHTIRDVTIQNSPMWTVHISMATGVYIGNATILAPSSSHNTDGIDVDCSQDVLIEDTYISNGDDCVCMKSGAWEMGRAAAVSLPSAGP